VGTIETTTGPLTSVQSTAAWSSGQVPLTQQAQHIPQHAASQVDVPVLHIPAPGQNTEVLPFQIKSHSPVPHVQTQIDPTQVPAATSSEHRQYYTISAPGKPSVAEFLTAAEAKDRLAGLMAEYEAQKLALEQPEQQAQSEVLAEQATAEAVPIQIKSQRSGPIEVIDLDAPSSPEPSAPQASTSPDSTVNAPEPDSTSSRTEDISECISTLADKHLSEQAVILDKKVGSATTEGSLDDSILDVDPTQMNLDDEKMKDYLSRLHALEEKNDRQSEKTQNKYKLYTECLRINKEMMDKETKRSADIKARRGQSIAAYTAQKAQKEKAAEEARVAAEEEVKRIAAEEKKRKAEEEERLSKRKRPEEEISFIDHTVATPPLTVNGNLRIDRNRLGNLHNVVKAAVNRGPASNIPPH